jgi:hypothetical protein
MRTTTLTIVAVAMGAAGAAAAEATKFPATLMGHAVLAADTSVTAPADAPADLKVAGKFTAPAGRRVDTIGAIEGTSFLSAKEAPHRTGHKMPMQGQSVQGMFGIKSVGDGTYFVLTDNGFGAKANSYDAMLMFRKVKPDWTTGKAELVSTVCRIGQRAQALPC